MRSHRFSTPLVRAALRSGRLLTAAALSLAALASHAFERPADGVYKDRIDWGLMFDGSGTASGSQIPWSQGVQTYIRQVNEAGGINGRKINLLLEDDRYDASVTRANYERLANQTPVLAISGLGNSSAQTALMQIIKSGKVPIVGSYALTRAGLEPANPMYYGGFCGFKEMAQVGVGFFSDRLKAKAPKVVVAHMDVAGGKEYAQYIEAEVSKLGGTTKALPIKIGAADVTSQVLEIMAMKPDFVTVYGVPSPTILLMKSMHQYGLKIPTFSITHLGTPEIYQAIGPEAGSNYYFVSCFTPGDIPDSQGVKDMVATAEKYGHGALKTNGNFIGGYVIGVLIAQAVAKMGPEPTREKLVEMLNKGFEVDTKGVSSPMKFTETDHRGLVGLRPYSFDYQSKQHKAYGKFSDFDKFIK